MAVNFRPWTVARLLIIIILTLIIYYYDEQFSVCMMYYCPISFKILHAMDANQLTINCQQVSTAIYTAAIVRDKIKAQCICIMYPTMMKYMYYN